MAPFHKDDSYLTKSCAQGCAHFLHLPPIPLDGLDSQHVCAGCYRQKKENNRHPTQAFIENQYPPGSLFLTVYSFTDCSPNNSNNNAVKKFL